MALVRLIALYTHHILTTSISGLATAVFIPFFTFRFTGSSPLVTAAILALFAGSTVQAATFNVDVGADGLTFSPPALNAADGDTIIFTLYVRKFYLILSYPITP